MGYHTPSRAIFMPVARKPLTAEDEHRIRVELMERFDNMPELLRQAYRECEFDLNVPKQTRGLDVSGLVQRILALRTNEEAIELNRFLK